MKKHLKAIAVATLPEPVLAAVRKRFGAGARLKAAEQARIGDAARLLAPNAALFFQSKAVAETVEGMLSAFSMAAMDCFLDLQDGEGTKGHILEFGVFKGRSAAILAHRVRSDERLILVDVEEYLHRDTIRAIAPQMEFLKSSSESFRSTMVNYGQLKRACRIIHVDSSHAYRTTLNEMSLCEELLSPGGIAILDDFTNLNYSQILAAVYKYLYTTNTDLTVFMVTDEKAYLCRKADFQKYCGFVLKGILPAMSARGLPDVCISRTDADPEYRAVYLRYTLPGETGPYYGELIYSQYYKEP